VSHLRRGGLHILLLLAGQVLSVRALIAPLWGWLSVVCDGLSPGLFFAACRGGGCRRNRAVRGCSHTPWRSIGSLGRRRISVRRRFYCV